MGVFAALALVAACTSSSSPVNGDATVSGGGGSAPDTNQTFTYDSYNQVIVDWDPAVEYTNPGNSVMTALYDSLTRHDAKTGKVTPDLATKWSATPDGKTWTFTLRAGIKFHDGRPVDAAAVKSAILRTKQLNQGAGYMWQGVTAIDTPSASTVVFHLSQPTPLDVIGSAAYSAWIYDTKAAGSADRRVLLHGPPVDATHIPVGCVFSPRCPMVVELCRTTRPALRDLGESRQVACHRAEELLSHPGGMAALTTVANPS